MMDPNAIQDLLAGHSLIRDVDQVPRGHVRIETAFLYPDGASVDLFLVQPEGLQFGGHHLSDLGQTTSWLLDVQVKPWLSKKRQAFVEDAIRLYGVRKHGGALEKTLETLDDLADGIVALGQSCVRVADLAYTKRSSLQSVFADEVEETVADLGLPYRQAVDLEGRRGESVRVDFLISGLASSTAVLTMSTGNPSTAHVQANEVFRRWYDLDIPERPEQRVTVFDDRYDSYRDDDLARIRDLSDVVPFSDSPGFAAIVAA